MARVEFLERATRTARAFGWIALFVVIWFAVTFVLSKVIVTPVNSAWNLAGDSLCALLGAVAATWVVGGRFDRHTWDQLGWHRPRLASGLFNGIALGVLMAALVIGLAYVTSRARVWVQPDWPRYLRAAGPLALGLLLAALFEELLFRGYPIRRLADALGPWAATAVTAIAFSVAHVLNPEITLIAKLNILLAGIWLAFAFFSPGGMPFAWGLHFGWNAGLALVFDAPVSGVRFSVPAVEYVPGQRSWLDGGAFGPEGGIVGTLVLVAGTLAVVATRFRQPKDWLV